MSDFLRENPIFLRTCILYEFAEGKPIFESFTHFCEVLGDEAMDYQEFEFWFQRFATGKMDLDFERSLEAATHTLADMPIRVFEKIIGNLDSMDRFIIRKVSKHFRILIDSLSPGFAILTIRIYESATTVCFDQTAVSYSNRPRQFYQKTDYCFVEIGDERKEIRNATHTKLALNDIKIVLENPKLELKEFEMERCNVDHSTELMNMFESLPQLIHIERLQMIVNNPLKELSILQYLRPQVLKTIHIDMENSGERLEKEELKSEFDRIIQLAQCQQMEMMTVVTWMKMEEFPVESFLISPRFTLHFDHLTVKDVYGVLRASNLLKFTQLDHFFLQSDQKLNIESLRKHLNQRFTDVPDQPDLMHFWDRKSNFSFEIRLGDYQISVERKVIAV